MEHFELDAVGVLEGEHGPVLAVDDWCFTDMVRTWADWATTVVDQWPDPPVGAGPDWRAVKEVASRPLPGSLGP